MNLLRELAVLGYLIFLGWLLCAFERRGYKKGHEKGYQDGFRAAQELVDSTARAILEAGGGDWWGMAESGVKEAQEKIRDEERWP